MKCEEIFALLDRKTEFLTFDDVYAYILDSKTYKLKRVWKWQEETGFEEIDIKKVVANIAKALKDKVDGEALLKEFLMAKAHPEEIQELKERVVDKEAKITSKPKECYSLVIGGKRGRPYVLPLVRNQGEQE